MTNPKHWNTFFRAEMEKESDRAAVVLAGSMLDQALETLLRARLVAAPTQSDSLFDGAYAPLSTFSAKIDMAYRIGLTSDRDTRALHLIRRIRNDFAHNITGCNFEDAGVRSRILELTRSQMVVQEAPAVRALFPEGPKGDLLVTASWLLWWLWTLAEGIVPFKAAIHRHDLNTENVEQLDVLESVVDGEPGQITGDSAG